ncbi:MAG: hypothetical protein ACPG43_08670 [Alcanivoracaceae bacterium]
MKPYVLALLVLVGHAQAFDPAAALTDQELSAVTGREGVVLDIALRNNVAEDGSVIGCTGTLNDCRIGLEFADRDGIWLMLKEFYGTFRIRDIRVDIATLPTTQTAYANEERFKSTSGSCLLGSLATCVPTGQRAVKYTYPGADGVGVYDDLFTFINIGRAALEYDSGGTPGYMRDAATGSVFGFRMSDSRGVNAPAQGRFIGEAYVFGF